jgi:hypothetical protein
MSFTRPAKRYTGSQKNNRLDEMSEPTGEDKGREQPEYSQKRHVLLANHKKRQHTWNGRVGAEDGDVGEDM